MLQEPYVAKLRLRLNLFQQKSILDQSELHKSMILSQEIETKKKKYRASLLTKPLVIKIKEPKLTVDLQPIKQTIKGTLNFTNQLINANFN